MQTTTKFTYFDNRFSTNGIEFERNKTIFDIAKHAYKNQDVLPKDQMPLLTPMLYKGASGQIRRKKQYLLGCANWWCIDVDDADEAPVEDWADFDCMVISTPSSTPENPRYRVFFQLDREIKLEEIDAFLLKIKQYFAGMSDPSCFDKSRIFYLPAKYPDSFLYRYHGEHLLLVDDILALGLIDKAEPQTSADNTTDSADDSIWERLDSIGTVQPDYANQTPEEALRIIIAGHKWDIGNRDHWFRFTGTAVDMAQERDNIDEFKDAWDIICRGYENYNRKNNFRKWDELCNN